MTTKDRENALTTRDLLDNMKAIFDIFGSPTLIHMKFANLELYAIKRLNYLVYNLDDYNPEGGGKDLKY